MIITVNKLAIIGGSGFDSFQNLKLKDSHRLTTPYGDPSCDLLEGSFENKPIFFLPRHGKDHHVAPHEINYRANMYALKQQGITHVLAINVVGGIHEQMPTGRLVIPDQIIDYSWGREHTFFSDFKNSNLKRLNAEPSPLEALGLEEKVEHIDFTEPYDQSLRQQLIASASSADIGVVDFGVYGVTQGPRLETAAEVRRLKNDGCDLVGMTAMPEAALARELGLAYASVCLVVNPAAGLADGPISMEEIYAVIESGMKDVQTLIAHFLSDWD